MPTEQEIIEGLADYFAWFEHDLGDLDPQAFMRNTSPSRASVSPSRGWAIGQGDERSGGRRRVAVAASLVLVVAGVAALVTLDRSRSDDSDGTSPSATQPPTGDNAALADSWSTFTSPPLEPRSGNLSIGTGDGWFVWGGIKTEGDYGYQDLNDGAYFDAELDEWRQLPPAPIRTEQGHVGSGVWTGNEILIVQGGSSPQVVAFNPKSFEWRTIPVPDNINSAWPQSDTGYATGTHRWIDGTVVMFFAADPEQGLQPGVLRLDPTTNNWSTAAAPPPTMTSLTGPISSSDSQLFVIGGGWTGEALLLAGGLDCPTQAMVRHAGLIDPSTGEWRPTTDAPVDLPWTFGPSVTIGDVVAAAGPDSPPVLYDRSAERWIVAPPFLEPNTTSGDTAMVGVGNRLAIWSPGLERDLGDGNRACCYPTGEVYGLTVPDWTSPATSPTGPAADVTGPSLTDPTVDPAEQLGPRTDAEIDRFIVVGMNVDVAEDGAVGNVSSLWQNTPHADDTSQALPAVNINTGSQSSPDLTDWQPAGESADVLGQTVELYTLNGDPLAVTWPTLRGTVVTIVGEGLSSEEFKQLLTRLRPLDAEEWANLLDAHPFNS